MNHDDLKITLKKLGWSDELIDAHFSSEDRVLGLITDNELVYVSQTIYEAHEPILRVDGLQNLATS